MRYSVATKENVYTFEADGCEVWEGKFIRFYRNAEETNQQVLPRFLRKSEVFEVRSSRKDGIALFPVEHVLMVTPMAVDTAPASGTRPRENAKRSKAKPRGPTRSKAKGDAHD